MDNWTILITYIIVVSNGGKICNCVEEEQQQNQDHRGKITLYFWSYAFHQEEKAASKMQQERNPLPSSSTSPFPSLSRQNSTDPNLRPGSPSCHKKRYCQVVCTSSFLIVVLEKDNHGKVHYCVNNFPRKFLRLTFLHFWCKERFLVDRGIGPKVIATLSPSLEFVLLLLSLQCFSTKGGSSVPRVLEFVQCTIFPKSIILESANTEPVPEATHLWKQSDSQQLSFKFLVLLLSLVNLAPGGNSDFPHRRNSRSGNNNKRELLPSSSPFICGAVGTINQVDDDDKVVTDSYCQFLLAIRSHGRNTLDNSNIKSLLLLRLLSQQAFGSTLLQCTVTIPSASLTFLYYDGSSDFQFDSDRRFLQVGLAHKNCCFTFVGFSKTEDGYNVCRNFNKLWLLLELVTAFKLNRVMNNSAIIKKLYSLWVISPLSISLLRNISATTVLSSRKLLKKIRPIYCSAIVLSETLKWI